MNDEKGLTLLELLVAMAIIGLLTAIVIIFGGRGLVPHAEERAMQAEKEIVERAVRSYQAIDLMEENATPIPASTEPVQLDPDLDAPPFSRYLQDRTTYYYTWDEGGENLQVHDSPN